MLCTNRGQTLIITPQKGIEKTGCAQLTKQRYINVTRRKIRNVCLTLSRPRATATTKREAKETEENPLDSTVNRHQFDYGDDYNQAHQSLAEPHESTATHGAPQNQPRADPTRGRGEVRGEMREGALVYPVLAAARLGGDRHGWSLEERRGGEEAWVGGWGRGAARRGEVWN